MTVGMRSIPAMRRSRRRTVALLIAAGAVACGIAAIGGFFGYRINVTPSEPLGLWRIVPLDRPVATGDLVFICPPARGAMRQAMARGYLRRGLCAGGYAPLVKTIVAVSGQQVEIGSSVKIDGRELASSRLMVTDGKGRTLVPFSGGIVPAGSVFLHSSFPGSWDSRYFGPIPASGILGLAQEVLTYGP
jgi:conjugative transfer signal peptidase TraF